jgi:hypothetical protein
VVRPWSQDVDSMPMNASGRRPYRGINALLLTLEANSQGYPLNRWLNVPPSLLSSAARSAAVSGVQRLCSGGCASCPHTANLFRTKEAGSARASHSIASGIHRVT